jgi:hypothetical protein
MPAAKGVFVFGGFMRFVLVVLIVAYLVLAFIGCLDRQMTIRNAAGKELNENHREIDSGGGPGGGRGDGGVVDSRLAASCDSTIRNGDRLQTHH